MSATSNRKGTAGRWRIRIIVDDPDALFEEYQGTVVLDATARVRDTPGGTREFGVRDMDRNGPTFDRDLLGPTPLINAPRAAPGRP
jgi:hypothetical protein